MTTNVNNKSDELIEMALRVDPSVSPDEYLQYLNEAAVADQYNFKPHVLFGSYFQKKEQYAEAAECYLHALNIDYTFKNDPNEAAKVYLNLGKIYQNLGEKTKSLIYYKDYIGLFPDTPHANRLAPQIYVKLKNFDNWFSSYKKARVALDEGKHKEAEKLFKFCLKVNPSFAWSAFYLAKSYLTRGVSASVADVLKKALKHREHYSFKYELYKFQFENSLPLDENLLTDFRKEAPYFVPGILIEAQKLSSIGENEKAAELFKQVVTAKPGSDFAQEALDGLFKIQSIEHTENKPESTSEDILETQETTVKPEVIEPPKPKARKGLLHKTPKIQKLEIVKEEPVEIKEEVVEQKPVDLKKEEEPAQVEKVIGEELKVEENKPQQQESIFPQQQESIFPQQQESIFPQQQESIFPQQQESIFPQQQESIFPQQQESIFPQQFETTEYQSNLEEPNQDVSEGQPETSVTQEVIEEPKDDLISSNEASALEFATVENAEAINPANVDPALDFSSALEIQAKLEEAKIAELRAEIRAESEGIINEAVSKAEKITEDAYTEAEIIKETAKKEYEELEQKLRDELAQERAIMLAERESMVAERENIVAEREHMLAEIEVLKADVKKKAEEEAAEKIEKAEVEAEEIRRQAEEDAEEARKEGQISAQVLRKRIEIEERYEELLLKLNKERKTLRLKTLDDAEKIIRAAEKRRDEILLRAETVSEKIERLSKEADDKYDSIYQTAIDNSSKMIEDIRQKAEEEGRHIIELANEEKKRILQNANNRAKEILDNGLARTYDVSDNSVTKIKMDYGSIADVTRQKIDEFCVELRNSFEAIFNQNVVEIKNKFNENLDDAIEENAESMGKFSESLKEELAKTEIADVFSDEEGLDPVPLNLLKDVEPVTEILEPLSNKLEDGSKSEFPPTENLAEGIFGEENEFDIIKEFPEPTEEEVKSEIEERVQGFVGEAFAGIDEEDVEKTSEEIINQNAENQKNIEEPVHEQLKEPITEQIEDVEKVENVVESENQQVEENSEKEIEDSAIDDDDSEEDEDDDVEDIVEESIPEEFVDFSVEEGQGQLTEPVEQSSEASEENIYNIEENSEEREEVISDDTFAGIPSEDSSDDYSSEESDDEALSDNELKDIFSTFMDDEGEE